MSVLIKGMDMPTGCLSCDFCNVRTGNPYCIRLMELTPKTSRLADCPFEEVKMPHGRLIDADKLMKDIAELKKSPWYNAENHAFYKEAVDIIESLCIKKALTVIEAEEEEK